MPPAHDTPTAVTIGNFDGVHVGHAALVRRARELAGPRGRVCVLAFDPHPFTRLRPEHAPARLSTFSQREAALLALGADEVVRLEPTDELLNTTAPRFVEWLVSRYGPRFVVEGEDFHFGKGREGNVRVLSELGKDAGFAVDVVPPVEVALGDDQIVRASSSIVRWLISHGRVSDAARVLGRPYELEGTVVKGDQRGRTIGFPTANLSTPCLLPADGVYAGVATLPDGTRLSAAVNVGVRPTFRGKERRLEAHLLGAGQLPDYDWPLRLKLIAWLREDLCFDDVDSLTRQIRRDCERTRAVLALRDAASPSLHLGKPA
jgi:riboflavin kinase/FMN adenylyltransferase